MQVKCPFSLAASSRPRASLVVRSGDERQLLGDNFGARDPTPGELASNFSDKVLGNYDTAHIIKIPDKSKALMGVTAQPIKPDAELVLLEDKEIDLLKNQVPGWKVLTAPDNKAISITQEWKGKDAAAASEIAKRLGSVLSSEEKGMAASSLSGIKIQGDAVEVKLTTSTLGGLTLNDFILASRMNDVNVKDLAAKKRVKYWA